MSNAVAVGAPRDTQTTMTEDLTRKIVVWATEIAKYAVALPSRRARCGPPGRRLRGRGAPDHDRAPGATPRRAGGAGLTRDRRGRCRITRREATAGAPATTTE